MSTLKIAMIQQKYHKSKKKTIKKTVAMIKQASKKNIDLVVLQELHQTHYFCQNENIKNFDLASSWDDDKFFWATISKKYKIVLVTSLFEKRTAGIYHNTVAVFDKDGSLCGTYRKMHIPDDPGFYEKFYFTPGDLGFEPIQTSIGKLGILICWDQWYPEAARLMTLKGATMLIYPTAIGWFKDEDEDEKKRQLEAWIAVQRGHAIANGIPIVTVNRVGFEADNSKVLDGILFWGNSFAFGTQGEFLAKGDTLKEEIIYCNINLSTIHKVRQWWPFLRDRRIESYGDITKRYID